MRNNAYVQRRRKVHRKRIRKWLITSLCTGLIVYGGIFWVGRNIKTVVEQVIYVVSNVNTHSTDETNNWRSILEEMAHSNERIAHILENENANPGTYPEAILKMLVSNMETLDFVENYPEKKDIEPADNIGDVQAGNVPLLLQWDERWGYSGYGDHLLATDGCGPTALAMVIAGLTGDNTITPVNVAKYSEDHGYYAYGDGTKWTLMSEGCSDFGLKSQELALSEGAIVTELSKGHPVICSMGPGDFTTSGHFIVIIGINNGKFEINDPNSIERSSQLWDYAALSRQINNLWAFSL